MQPHDPQSAEKGCCKTTFGVTLGDLPCLFEDRDPNLLCESFRSTCRSDRSDLISDRRAQTTVATGTVDETGPCCGYLREIMRQRMKKGLQSTKYCRLSEPSGPMSHLCVHSTCMDSWGVHGLMRRAWTRTQFRHPSSVQHEQVRPATLLIEQNGLITSSGFLDRYRSGNETLDRHNATAVQCQSSRPEESSSFSERMNRYQT